MQGKPFGVFFWLQPPPNPIFIGFATASIMNVFLPAQSRGAMLASVGMLSPTSRVSGQRRRVGLAGGDADEAFSEGTHVMRSVYKVVRESLSCDGDGDKFGTGHFLNLLLWCCVVSHLRSRAVLTAAANMPPQARRRRGRSDERRAPRRRPRSPTPFTPQRKTRSCGRRSTWIEVEIESNDNNKKN